jgi:hypothetical protein
MESANRGAELYAGHVRLELGGGRYPTERQERELLLAAGLNVRGASLFGTPRRLRDIRERRVL